MVLTGSEDAYIVGSGPNGLAAAIALAGSGLRVCVIEGSPSIGGCARSAELTLPGFVHDTGSAVHPMAAASPFFKSLPLSNYGLEWILPPAAVAHPFDDGTAALLHRSVHETAATLGRDSSRYSDLFTPLLEDWDSLLPELLGTMRMPRHPLALARFALKALQPATALAEGRFQGERARGLIAGLCAHSILPLDQTPGAAFGLALGLAGHAVGWPIPAGGAGSITRALAAYFKSNGGVITTGKYIQTADDLPSGSAVFWDVTPAQLLRIPGLNLPAGYRRSLQGYRYGPGAFKVDWALRRPIPWKAAECRLAGTVHLGGTLEEIAVSEKIVRRNKVRQKPFVLLAQPSLFDSSRAPGGNHTAWAYCHVPNGYSGDMTDPIEAQVERFAPGFRRVILARRSTGPAELERDNPNLVGGDISGGAQSLRQLFARPALRLDPYRIPAGNMYICSSSTPPGAGVHGMCGLHAAQSYLGHR